ncbi:MAG: hypothetical protein P8Y64_05620 [Gammaproteobacteria bacterium]|jgi:hypothetical protein
MAGKISTAPEMVLRRRAIFTGLGPFFDAEERVRALCIWQDNFSSGPVYALHDFISLICDSPQRLRLRGEIHRSLLKALNSQPGELDPDPKGRMESYCQKRKLTSMATPSGQRPQDVMFESLLGGFFKYLERLENDAAVKTRVYLMEHVPRMDLGPVGDSLSEWLAFKQDHIGRGLSESQMRKLLHMAYVSACELCGPVQTDRALATAKRDAETMPEAGEFAPGNLL